MGNKKNSSREPGPRGPALNWIHEVDLSDILDKDAALIVESCGLETMLILWENLPSMSLYISELPLHKAKKRYIRKLSFEAGKCGKTLDVKRVALQLNVSARFVELALATTEVKDERQGKLL